MQEWIVPGALGALTLLALVLAVVLFLGQARARRELQLTHAEAAALRAQMDELERRMASSPRAPTGREYVITQVGEELSPAEQTTDETAVRIEGSLFADLVLRETVVRAASLAHGVRVALAPESRNRIRFEVRREVRRARKQRRADLKAARRDWEARQRADLDGEDAA